MHGPDGTDDLRLDHLDRYRRHRSGSRCCTVTSRDDPNAFESTLAFAPHGTASRIVMRTVFPTTNSATGA